MSEEKKSNTLVKGILIAIGTIAIGGGLAPMLLDYFSHDPKTEIADTVIEEVEAPEVLVEVEQKPLPVTPKPIPKIKPAPETVIAATPIAEPIPLPALYESDQFILQEISATAEEKLFIPDGLINNMVVFVDNFSRGSVVSNFSPLVQPEQRFSVVKQGKSVIMDSKSYRRYDRYAEAVDAIDVDNFIGFYKQITPLIDEAYQEIGYPQGTFNTTFEKAIDQLLQTPIIHYKLELVSPSAMYKYADESLESLPDTQKLMLRMGPDNLQTVQQKLRQIKTELQRL